MPTQPLGIEGISSLVQVISCVQVKLCWLVSLWWNARERDGCRFGSRSDCNECRRQKDFLSWQVRKSLSRWEHWCVGSPCLGPDLLLRTSIALLVQYWHHTPNSTASIVMWNWRDDSLCHRRGSIIVGNQLCHPTFYARVLCVHMSSCSRGVMRVSWWWVSGWGSEWVSEYDDDCEWWEHDRRHKKIRGSEDDVTKTFVEENS